MEQFDLVAVMPFQVEMYSIYVLLILASIN